MKNDTVKFGLLYGFASILIILAAYFTNPKAIVKPLHWTTALHFAVMIGLMYMAAKTVKDKKGGFIPFGEAFVPSFGTYAIGSFIGSSGIFTYLLVNHFDPSLIPLLGEASMEAAESMMDMAGMPEEQKLEALEAVERENEGKNPFDLSQTFLGWLMGLFIYGLPISAIIAAIVKKKEPMPIV